MDIEHFKEIMNLIQTSEETGLLFKGKNLSGYSGESLIGALQRIAHYQEEKDAGCYLEIGVYQGLTLLSVAGALEKSTAHGIDNFSQFDPYKKNQSLISDRAEVNELSNYNLINADYEDALENLQEHLKGVKVGIYFVDGPHDYRSQLVCLQLAKPYLSDRAIIVVDDCNYRHVRLANRDFLVANPEYKLLYESYTECHPANMDEKIETSARKGWWNGVNIIVPDPENVLDRMYPETTRDRALYENDHIVHSEKYGVLAKDALSIVQAFVSGRFFRTYKLLRKTAKKVMSLDIQHIGKYDSINTFSDDLTKGKMNSKLM